MLHRRRVVAAQLITLVGLVALAACGTEPAADASGPDLAALQAEAETLRATMGGAGATGFMCTGGADGTIACVCSLDSTSPVDSCDGMETVCGLLGTGSICNPWTRWCHCRGGGLRAH